MDTERQLIKKFQIQGLKSKFGEIKIHKQVDQTNSFHVKPDDKYEYIKHRLLTLKQHFLDALDIPDFKPVNSITTEEIYIFGMILNINDEKLTPDSIYIISNIDNSNNTVVKLQLKSLDAYSLFPGQIVSLCGVNATGIEFSVHKICSLPVLDLYECEREELIIYNEIYKNNEMVICMSNGPFLGQYGNIMDRFLKFSCDIFILCGPFLDSYREEFDPFDFFDVLMQKLDSWLRKDIKRKIILVPSTEDLNLSGLFPQTQIENIKHERIYCLTNPNMFSINEILFSVCVFDNLMCLATGECYKKADTETKDEYSNYLFSKDRIFRLSSHLIYQKCFTPVFPLNEPVDYSNPSDLDMLVTPHILITTSKLKEFDKIVGPSRVINLGMQLNPEHKKIVRLIVKPLYDDLDACSDSRFIVTFHNLCNDSENLL